MDEVGKMESYSDKFCAKLKQFLLNSSPDRPLLLATVPIRSLKIADELKLWPGSSLIELNAENRNDMRERVFEMISTYFDGKKLSSVASD